MKLLLIISVFTSISAIQVPSAWQPQTNQNANVNNVNRDDQPIRQPEIVPQAGPNYNNINPYINNVPNAVSNGFTSNGNLFSNVPVDYDWFNVGVPNNGYAFTNPIAHINSGNLLNTNANANGGNEIRRKPYVQQRQGPPRLVQSQINYNRRPVVPGNPGTVPYNEAQGQVPYITYTTQRPTPQIAAFNNLRPIQKSEQAVNVKQAYPQVNNPTVLPLTDLDFSPLNPFPHSPQEGQATQINNQNTGFSTAQPISNLDFSLNNLFSRKPQVNGYQVAQLPQVPINNPFHAATLNRKSANKPTAALRNLDFNPFTKNYRDHRTHEPTLYDPNYNRDAVPLVERLESERAPIVKNHEHPEEVPTRPIYPGEAQWSKPGVKHRPFVTKQQYTNLEEPKVQPDGYDTFFEGQKLFENQKAEFGQKLQHFPSNNLPTQQSTREENTEEGEIFVPTRLYAQVRHTEDEKHLPPESDENGRLKELVKDSKVQTIYSEEGYEDSAYDHAGHEKKAENIEGFESDEKNKEAKEKKKIPAKKYNKQSSSYSIGDQDLKEEDIEKLKKEALDVEDENEEDEDSEPAGTHYEGESYLNKVTPLEPKDSSKNVDENTITKSKEIKTVTAKDKTGENIEMEISSEVKAIPQPNNGTKFHKYVKIYPKINKNATANINLIENENSSLDREKEGKFNIEKRTFTLNPKDIFIEEIISSTTTEEYISTTPTPTEYTEIVTMEIPTTTEATTSLPKLEKRTEDKSSKGLERPLLKLHVRRKRSAVGIPTIEVDTDFIDEINHDLGKPTEKPIVPIEKKYPYYKAYKEKGLHENSPLRYSEDLKKVPIKAEGRLAFYDLADKKIACSDVNPEVDPVPDRIKDADESVEDEEEDEEGNDPASKEPRLGKLGDKIDCFKVKYFGEEPLDNPFFQEELVGPVKPIFSEIESMSTKKNADNVSKKTSSKRSTSESNASTNIDKSREPLHAAASNYATKNEIDDSSPHKYGLRSWFPGKSFGLGENTERDSKYINHFVEKNPNPKVNIEVESKQPQKSNNNADDVKSHKSKEFAMELPPLITTPKYTVELKPKHIYDQIELLAYLPEDELDEVKKAINAELPKLNLTEITTSSPNTSKTEAVLSAPVPKKKKSGKNTAERRAKVLKNVEESIKMETSDNTEPESFSEIDALQLKRIRPRKPLYEIFDINKFIPKVPKIPPNAKGINPNFLATFSIRNPTYQIFDINKFLPTTPFPLFKEFITQSTVLPKYKVLSEVFYKDDIKPNEQLNVFTDVLKHIENFPKMKDSFPESSEPISVKLNTEKISEKFPQNIFRETQMENKDYLSSTIKTIMTTFDPKKYASNHRYPQAESPFSAQKQIEDMMSEFKTSNKPKRRRIKTTTQETPVVIEESTSTLQYIGEPTDVMGLMPPIIQGYKTIYHPKRDNSQHISNPTIRIEERKINKYYFQGMRPPPKQKIYLYSDFLTDNHITQRMSKPKRNKLRRSKRSAQRPAYAQVSRNKTKPLETKQETKKEEDDYVPNRSRNYHYDEKTGKIVYDKKLQEPMEDEEEVEYIEVVEETPKTTEKPKQSPVFATATPPPAGQSYTDFVKLLKGALNYREIPDPTTTEKGAEEVTQQMVASTLEPVSTTAPEFLSILAKVRNDSNYKLIEDKKKTTTTSKPIEEEQEEEKAESSDEESQTEDIKNSPGGQGYDSGANFEIFDIADFLPNVKSYLPKTSVDTSKYKSIERPNLRHSLSSRYNSDEEKDLQNVNTNKQPILPNSEKASTKETEQKQDKTSNPGVIIQRVRIPGRRRTTTVNTLTVQDEASITTQAPITADESTVANEDKAKRRRRRRRRPTRIKVKSVTGEDSEPVTDAPKIVRRRSERDSHLHAEGNEKYEQFVETDGTVPSLPIRMEDYVDYEEITDNLNSTDVQQLDNIDLVAKKVVDVFKNYNKDQKHGGNYKKEDEVIKQDEIVKKEEIPKQEKVVKQDEVVTAEKQGKLKDSVEVIKPYDKLKKHGGNYKAEKEDIVKQKENLKPVKKIDPKDIKKVEVIKDYDKTKKHGGNYKPANEEVIINEQDEAGLERNESIQISNVNVFQDYDKTKKHGGNYKSANDTSEEQQASIELEEPVLLKNVEIFKDYDETKEHGGNYKPENDTVIPEQQLEESQFGSPQIRQNVLNDGTDKKSSVEVFKNYDETKKHGGNYRRENENLEKGKTLEDQQAIDKTKDIEIFKNYDETKKTGGNYRREEEEIIEPKAEETQYTNSKIPQTKRYVESRNNVQRLADVVLKPETFYSDLRLPLDINALKIIKDLPSEELEEIVKSAEVDTDISKKEGVKKVDDEIATVVTIGNKIKIPPIVEEPVTSTKKPLFIKDPSKRLYFYAPVR